MNTIETGPSDNARDSEMWSRSWTQFRVDRRSAEQVIVAANAYGSSKLLHHMQHKGLEAGHCGGFRPHGKEGQKYDIQFPVVI
jgi:hypothetical protein